MIRTVTGDIARKDLGITMCHEHFIFDLARVRHDDFSFVKSVDEVVPEVGLMMEYGVRSAFEMTTNDMGRDVGKLKELSGKTKLQIVAATGFYLTQYHPDFIASATVRDIADIFVKDLTIGVGDTGIKAGIIGEIASSPERFEGFEKKILLAAALAAKETGAAVSTHTGRHTVYETVETLLENGVAPDKIIIGHQDLLDDHDYHMSVLKYGVNIAFDTCGKVAYMADEARALNARKIIEAGYGDHLLLSNDVSRKTYYVSNGGTGYTGVMKKVVPLMREYGVKDEDILKLLCDNPARIADNENWK